MWGYKSDVWRLRRNTKRRRTSAERSAEPSPRPLLSPLPPPIGAPLALSQLPDWLEAQLKASARAYMDIPVGEPCEVLSGHAQAMLASTQSLADRAATNLALLRSAAAAMSPAELAEPLAWMARSQEIPRQLDEHLMMAFAGVTANGASLRTAMEAGPGCDPRFIQQSNGDLARFLCQAQSAMALMRQDICGRFFACCCLVGELLVDVLGFQVAMLRLQLREELKC